MILPPKTIVTGVSYFFAPGIVLTAIFVALDCCDIIDWPWVWLTSPLWITVAVFVSAIVALSASLKILSYAFAFYASEPAKQKDGGNGH